MSITLDPGEQRTLLRNIAWHTFLDLCEQREGSVPRMTYDRGELELMSPRRQHEELGCFIGRLIETFTEVKEIDIRSVASTTFKRHDLTRAFEADESYYIENVEPIWRKEEVDLSIDPSPDLVVEVELTSSAIAKMPLFAAMGVPEVWRHDGKSLCMLSLVSDEYQAIDESVQLPGLTTDMIDSVLSKRFEVGETQLIRGFRQRLETS
ncbi:MAG: Uma2 family endonuclease [Planctomycetota bacterium]